MPKLANTTTQIFQAIVGGLIATLLMTGMMLMAPKMGMPEMNVGAMLANMIGASERLGWAMHFMVGIGFAFVYCLVIRNKLPIRNNLISGLIFGIMVFIFAQIMMYGMTAVELMSSQSSGEVAIENAYWKGIMGSLMGHMLYGFCLGYFIRKENHS